MRRGSPVSIKLRHGRAPICESNVEGRGHLLQGCEGWCATTHACGSEQHHSCGKASNCKPCIATLLGCAGHRYDWWQRSYRRSRCGSLLRSAPAYMHTYTLIVVRASALLRARRMLRFCLPNHCSALSCSYLGFYRGSQFLLRPGDHCRAAVKAAHVVRSGTNRAMGGP